MKIDPTGSQPIGGNAPIGRTERADLASAGAQKAEGVAGGLKSDQVTLSQRALDMQLARKALADVPAIRHEKVQALKARIQAGEYQVDTKEVARKLLEGQ